MKFIVRCSTEDIIWNWAKKGRKRRNALDALSFSGYEENWRRKKKKCGGRERERRDGGTTGRKKKKEKREKGSADMPVYLGISCVKGGRGERRGGGGGRVEKEVESSTTLAGVTLEELEQTLLEKKKKKNKEGSAINSGSFHYFKRWSVNTSLD